MQGKYGVGLVVKGASSVKLRSANGTLIVRLALSEPLAWKVKVTDEADVMIFWY
jgi:hypothetical protein